MGYDQPDRSGSSGSFVAVLVVALLVVILGGLLLVGVGTLFWVRTARFQQQTVVELRRAEAERARAVAEAEAERLHAEAIAQVQRESAESDASDSQPALTVNVSDDGNMSVDGEQIELAELRERLDKLKEETSNAIVVRIEVDAACPAKQLVQVLAACDQVGDVNYRVTTIDKTESAAGERGDND